MPSNAAQEFLELAERSGLVAPATARETLAQLTTDGAATTDNVGEHLVEKKVLTTYQEHCLHSTCLRKPPAEPSGRAGVSRAGRCQ